MRQGRSARRLAGEAQHHDERPENALGAPDLDLSEVGPVDLRLLAGERFEALKRLRWLARPIAANDSTEVIGAALIASLLDHLKQPARAQPRVFLELLDDERQKRIRHRWPWCHRGYLDASLLKHALDRGVMDTELPGDRAHRPLLCMEQPQYVGFRLLGDHRPTSTPRRWPTRQSR